MYYLLCWEVLLNMRMQSADYANYVKLSIIQFKSLIS